MPSRFDLSGLDPSEVGRLMKLLAATDIEECEIEQGEFRISVRRTAIPPRTDGWTDFAVHQGDEASDEPLVVLSPAVGFFFRSDSRSAPPSADVGARVQMGDALGSIEVMGVPHAVFSTHDGVVESFLVEDGEAVEYGQPIVAISVADY
jgi:acetyl-CoA carboxylase biotin carboxyl carrier protein